MDEAALRDGLAWRKLKRFQLLLAMIRKSMNDVSSLKVMQGQLNEEVNKEIKEFESGLQKLRQHKFSIYRRQQQFWMDGDGKLWKKWEIEKYKNDLKLQAIGDDFVMAIQDLAKDFEDKFKNIVPIGPISNYHQIQANETAVAANAAEQQSAGKKGKNKSDVITNPLSPPKSNKTSTTSTPSSSSTTTTSKQ